MKIKIRTVPDPILRKKSKPVKTIDPKINKVIKELKTALLKASNPPGVGLSAVQIGKLFRIFVARENLQAEPQVFINPEITWRSKELTNGVPDKKNKLEGCLSIPGYYGLVKRHQAIRLKYRNSQFAIRNSQFTGFLATVIQHEIDHLNGILFVDRVLKQGNKLYKLERDKLLPVEL